MGKLLGLGAAGLLQVGLYVVLIIIPGTTVLSFFDVPLGGLMLSLVYFALGYTLFACLMAGFGMIGRTQQETAQLSAHLDARRGEPDVVHHGDHRGTERPARQGPLVLPVDDAGDDDHPPVNRRRAGRRHPGVNGDWRDRDLLRRGRSGTASSGRQR